MEENNNNVNNINDINNEQQPKKKKGKGIKIFFIVLITVIAILALGLLIRYAIVQDSYFAPFEKMFGLSDDADEEDDTDDDNLKEEINEEINTNKTQGRKTLLSSEATEKGVSHYTLELDVAELIEMGLELYTVGANNIEAYSLDGVSNNNSEYTMKKLNATLISEDFENYSIEAYDNYEDDYYMDDYDSDYSYDDSMASMEDQITEILEYLDGGKIIVDLYAKGDEIIQVIVTVEYEEMLENIYDYMVENEVEEVKSFDSAKEFQKYVEMTLNMYLNEETIMSAIEEELEANPEDMPGINIEEIEECFDMISVDGAYEFYFTVPDEINDMLAEFIEDNAEDMEADGVDPDNFIESFVEYFNEMMEDEGYDQFVIEKE